MSRSWDNTEYKYTNNREKHRVKELAILNKIGRAIASTKKLDELWELTYKQTCKLLDISNYYISLYDRDREELNNVIDMINGKARPNGKSRRKFGSGRTEYVIRTNKPLLISGDISAIYKKLGITTIDKKAKSYAGVPITISGKVFGILAVQSYEYEDAYDLHTIEILSTIANQAAIAIENARLYNETQRRLKEMTALQKVGMEFISSLDISKVLQCIAESTLELTDGHLVHIFSRDPETKQFTKRAAAWSPQAKDHSMGWPRKDGLVATVIKEQKPRIIEDVMNNPLTNKPDYRKMSVRSMGSFPLKGKWGVSGTLNVLFLKTHSFTKEECDLLTLLANQAAIAIENARLYNETQRRLKEMTALQKVGMEFISSLDISKVLQCIAESTLELTDGHLVHIFSRDPETKQFTKRAAAWSPQAKDHSMGWPRKDGLVATVIKEQKPRIIEDVMNNPLTNKPDYRKMSVRSMGSFPLKGKWGVSGTLNVLFLKTHSFTKEECDLLTLLANQAAIAIENARLYEKTKQLATTDHLTGVWNRRYIDEYLHTELARAHRFNRHVSILMIDIDKFKSFNDIYGHLSGDAVINDVAQSILRSCRKIDVAGRYGGDEFAVILLEADISEAISVAERILFILDKHPFSTPNGTLLPITTSIGIASYPSDGKKAEQVFSAADSAMYRAKLAGGGQYAVFGTGKEN